MGRYSASNALWRQRRYESDATVTPTPEDLACRIYHATIRSGAATVEFPLLAVDETHAYEVAHARAEEDGNTEFTILIRPGGLPYESVAMTQMLLANEPGMVKDERRARVRRQQEATR